MTWSELVVPIIDGTDSTYLSTSSDIKTLMISRYCTHMHEITEKSEMI